MATICKAVSGSSYTIVVHTYQLYDYQFRKFLHHGAPWGDPLLHIKQTKTASQGLGPWGLCGVMGLHGVICAGPDGKPSIPAICKSLVYC